MGLDLSHGGHLTHGMKLNVSGRTYESEFYQVDPETQTLNYETIRQRALEVKPKIIVAGASAYPRIIDFKKFREIADEVGAYLFVDMAHIAGLVAAGLHPNPVPYADFVTTTTHKTLRGPRGGIIMCKEEYAKKINSAVFPGQQGGPLMHIIAAKAVAFKEALSPEFRQYAAQIIANAKVMSEQLLSRGVNLVSGGTDNHLMLIDLRGTGVTGKDLQERLDDCNITANKNTIPFDPEKPMVTSGVRIGTPAVTARGFKEEDCKIVADCIADCIFDYENKKADVIARVKALTDKYPIYPDIK